MNTETTYFETSVQGIRMRCASSGTGATVILLHGFPETHRSWDLQVPALVAAGYRVIRPDLRGYGGTDKPRDGYDIDTLGGDIAALIRTLDAGPVVLVGHDWGGAIAWYVASRYPGLVRRLIILNCPHPVIMAKAVLKDPGQARRSWYMFFFQIPRLPEHWLTMRKGRNITRLFRASSSGTRRPPRELTEYSRQSLLEPGAARAAIAYYRAALRDVFPPWRFRRYRRRFARVEVPVTVLWGVEDTALGVRLLDGLEEFAPGAQVHRIADAGHFVHQERPDLVNRLMLASL